MWDHVGKVKAVSWRMSDEFLSEVAAPTLSEVKQVTFINIVLLNGFSGAVLRSASLVVRSEAGSVTDHFWHFFSCPQTLFNLKLWLVKTCGHWLCGGIKAVEDHLERTVP